MSDDEENRGADASAVVTGVGYEVRYFAEANGMTVERARQLIRTFRNDREDSTDEARQLED
jgi:hypothetical protein